MQRVGTQEEFENAIRLVLANCLDDLCEIILKRIKLVQVGWKCPFHGPVGTLGCKSCKPIYQIEIPDADIRLPLPHLPQAS